MEKIIIIEAITFEKAEEDIKTLIDLSKGKPKNLELLKELNILKKYDKTNFVKYIQRIWEPIKKGEEIRFITAESIKIIRRRKQRAGEVEAIGSTGRSFTGEHSLDTPTKNSLSKERDEKKAKLDATKKELIKTQLEAVEYAKSLERGKSVGDKNLRRVMVQLTELKKTFRDDENDFNQFQEKFDIFIGLFDEAYKEMEDISSKRDDQTIKRTSDAHDTESKTMGQAGKESDAKAEGTRKRNKRTEEIKKLDFDNANVKTILKACNDVATMQLPAKGVFSEALNTGLLTSRMFKSLQRIKGGPRAKFQEFYNEIALGFIEMVKNVVENYKDAGQLMKKHDLLNVLRSIESTFDDEFEEYVDGYKKGDLEQKAEEAWGSKQKFFHGSDIEDRQQKFQLLMTKSKHNETNLKILEKLKELRNIDLATYDRQIKDIEDTIIKGRTVRDTTPERIQSTIDRVKDRPKIQSNTVKRKTGRKRIILIKRKPQK